MRAVIPTSVYSAVAIPSIVILAYIKQIFKLRKDDPMRNPNGYGSVVKLSGNRRRPFCVRKAVTKWNAKGHPVYEIIGYYATRKEALQALADYNSNPYDLGKAHLTVAEVYEMWSERKFKEISESLSRTYRAGYGRLEAIHNTPMVELRAAQLQDLLDGLECSAVLKKNTKLVIKMLYAFAMTNEIVNKDISVYLKTPTIETTEKRPFTEDELRTLWDHADAPGVDDILILIYTGWRANEYCSIRTEDIDLEEMTMKGGSKTEAGKDRIVPIHHRIQPLVLKKYDKNRENFMQVNYARFYREFKATMDSLSIDHSPHETRHTFITMLDNAGANPAAIKRLVGHSSKDITTKAYIHKDIEQLRKAIELLP